MGLQFLQFFAKEKEDTLRLMDIIEVQNLILKSTASAMLLYVILISNLPSKSCYPAPYRSGPHLNEVYLYNYKLLLFIINSS